MAGLPTSAASATTVESGGAVDSACGTDPTTKSPDAGEPWDYYACIPAAQRCNAWIFKDGFEGGDGGLW